MATRLIVIDSGGTARTVRRPFVIDSGGTARLLRRAFVIDSGGTGRLIFISVANITISDQFVECSQSSPTPGFAVATYRLNSSGIVQSLVTLFNGSTATTTLESWTDSPSTTSEYECLATLTSGSVSGTFGTWLALGTSRSWTATRASPGTTGGGFSLQIRKIGDTTVLDTAQINVQANVDA